MALNQRKRAGAKAVSAMIRAMLTRPHTYIELVGITGLSQPTISGWIREMRAAKLVMVGNWIADARGILTVPAFSFGFHGIDMTRPAKTAAQRVAEYRQRKNGGAS